MSKEALRDNTKEDLIENGVPVSDLSVSDLFAVLYRGRFFVIVVSLLFAAGAYYYSKSIPEEYRSAAILNSATSSGSGALMGQLGGVASLAGINLGISNKEDKVAIAMELLQTWSFLEQFVKDNELEIEVFAAKGWDKASNQLKIDPNVYDEDNHKWLMGNDSDEQGLKPSSWQLFAHIRNRISVSRDLKTGLVTLAVIHYSPHVAKKWVDLLVVAINKQIQAADKRDAEKSISYLKKQINETDISDMRSVFYQLIEEQTKKLMLAEVREEYVFKTLSEAKVAEIRSKPNRKMITVIGFVLGGLLSVCVLFIRFALRSKRTGSNFSGKNYDK